MFLIQCQKGEATFAGKIQTAVVVVDDETYQNNNNNV